MLETNFSRSFLCRNKQNKNTWNSFQSTIIFFIFLTWNTWRDRFLLSTHSNYRHSHETTTTTTPSIRITCPQFFFIQIHITLQFIADERRISRRRWKDEENWFSTEEEQKVCEKLKILFHFISLNERKITIHFYLIWHLFSVSDSFQYVTVSFRLFFFAFYFI